MYLLCDFIVIILIILQLLIKFSGFFSPNCLELALNIPINIMSQLRNPCKDFFFFPGFWIAVSAAVCTVLVTGEGNSQRLIHST